VASSASGREGSDIRRPLGEIGHDRNDEVALADGIENFPPRAPPPRCASAPARLSRGGSGGGATAIFGKAELGAAPTDHNRAVL